MTLARDHWIRRNDTSWTPRRILVLDVEGRTAKVPEGELDTFRLAVASFTVRAGDRDAAERTEEEAFTDPAALWSWIAHRAHHGHSTWCFAHGLHYDYTCGAAHRELAALGWERVDWSTRAGARWVRWRKGRRTLLLVDLFNYLAMPLEQIGKALGIPKLTMPRQAARAATWERYCRRDVKVTREAVLHLLAWWDTSDLGRWTLTSAGLAFNAFRHRFMAERMIRSHDVPEARTLEREALFGGRREIHRKGRLPDGLWVDLDYVSHYAMTAGMVDVPVQLGQVYSEVRPDLLDHLPANVGVIARVEVEVDAPVVPYRHHVLGVLYPVGRFVTTLCQPELALVQAHGRIVRWLEVATYQLAPALESWAEWLLPLVNGPGKETDTLARTLLKDWTRSLIGKFGQRARDHDPAPRPDGVTRLPDLEVSEAVPVPDLPWVEGAPLDPLRGQDSYNAVPAITAWIHSAARVWLWGGMTTAGLEDLAYTDTDGFLVQAHPGNLDRLALLDPRIRPDAPSPMAAIPEPAGHRRPATHAEKHRAKQPRIGEEPAEDARPGTMAVKGRYGGVTVHRSQDYELDRAEVIKGLPRARERIGDRTYRAEYWPGIPWQLAHAEPGTFLRPIRTVHLLDHYDRGWVVADGRVLPLEVRPAGRGVRILAWSRTRWARAGARLQDPAQARRIARAGRSPPA